MITKAKSLADNSCATFKKLITEEMGFVYTTIGGLGASVFGALFWLILASLLSVENYGLANYFIAIATISAGVATIGLNMTVTTFIAKGDKKILYEANSLTLLSGLLIAVVISIFDWTTGILSASTVFFMMALAEALGKRSYKEYAFLQIGQKIIQICLSLILYYAIGIAGVILGYFIGNLIFSYKYFFSLKNFTLKVPSIKAKLKFTFHSYGYNLIGVTLSNYLDKIIVGALFGYYILGLYQLGFQFFMFLYLIPMSLQQYLLPEESSGKNRRQLKVLSVIIAVVAAVALFVVTPYLISTFFPTFFAAIFLVQLMSLAIIPSTITAILTASFLAREKSKEVLIAGVIFIIALVAVLVLMGFLMGVAGLAIAVIVARTIQAGYLISKRNA